ncbi:MAG: hypothetical protein IJF65_01010, partial [Clostridia bacterium]|nr:hypothetical protein [Clostridia bacterium]
CEETFLLGKRKVSSRSSKENQQGMIPCTPVPDQGRPWNQFPKKLKSFVPVACGWGDGILNPPL